MKISTTCICQWALVATVVVVWPPAYAFSAVAYRVTDLGTLGGQTSRATAINNLGQVVGTSYTSDPILPNLRAFRTAPNATINPATDNLGTLGGTYSIANDINDRGQVVGGSYIASSVAHAFRTKPNAPIDPITDDLGTLGGEVSTAAAINESGQVVGFSYLSGHTMPRAFRTGPNAAIQPATDNLGTLGGTESVANGINNSGQVVGYSTLPGNPRPLVHAFRTSGPGPMNAVTDDIGIAVGSSIGEGINDSGQVTGDADYLGTTIGMNNGFRTAPNEVISPATDDLGTLPGSVATYPHAINSAGWVVGSVLMGTRRVPRPFLYDGTTTVELNNVLDETGIGWMLEVARDINDRGQIVGYGIHNGARRAFRLDPIPIPEPSTFAITVVAACAMITCFFHTGSRPVPSPAAT